MARRERNRLASRASTGNLLLNEVVGECKTRTGGLDATKTVYSS